MVTHFIDKDNCEEKVEHFCNLGPLELHMYQSFSASYNIFSSTIYTALEVTGWVGRSFELV